MNDKYRNKCKKIGIVTIHTDFNYGAVLQAVATQKFLEFNGFDAEIINYENPIIGAQSHIIYKQGGEYTGYIKTFIRNIFFGRYFYYKKAIQDLDAYRKISTMRYKRKEDLDSVPYDIIIAGSDQIWNPDISRGIDPVFLLEFGGNVKRISIATSLGSYKLRSEDCNVFKNAFKYFESISVREKHAKDQLQPLTDKIIKVILDPTLLLSKSDWLNLIGHNSRYSTKKQKYILTYFVGGEKSKYRPIVSEYAKTLNLPLWTIQYSNYTWKESDKKILGASIVDFIALIANADLVITDSFHGVAFSINLGVNFIPVTNVANPIRVKELLIELGMEERMDMTPATYHPVCYEMVIPKLASLREDSKKWIIDAINN